LIEQKVKFLKENIEELEDNDEEKFNVFLFNQVYIIKLAT